MNHKDAPKILANTVARVMILGETGTGKSRLAREIHEASGRTGPFVICDCGALSQSLAESLLFGHVRGAFSGAVADHAGYFEEANGGTLFLDEIGELPLEVQPRLLRALQDARVRRVGGRKDVPFDVRVISATHRDLSAEIKAGRFRQDLYYRLRGVEVVMPPLRERRDELAAILGAVRGLSDEAAAALASADHDWPGNIREALSLASLAAELGWGADEVRAQLGADQTRAARPVWTPKAEAVRVIEAVVSLAQRPQGVSTAEVFAVGRYRHMASASHMLSRMVARGFLKRARNGIYFSQR